MPQVQFKIEVKKKFVVFVENFGGKVLGANFLVNPA